MNIYIIIWVIFATIISIWVSRAIPSKKILSQYSYKTILLGIISPSSPSSSAIKSKDIEIIQSFLSRFRFWSLFILGSIICVVWYSFFTTDKQLVELQNIVEQVEKAKEISEK